MTTSPSPEKRLRIDAPASPRRGHLALGDPEGTPDRIEVTSRWIERGGEPWYPLSGEIHYSRLPRERWDEVLGHAKAGGINTVATYVLWQAHEPEPGEFRWDGNLDLRGFLQLVQAHGMDAIVRLGPWAHGEARYGGFPDWLVGRNLATRTNDPSYLALVRALYAQIIAQLRGLTHAEGGPVVGVQVDNELYDQPQHLAMLRVMAEELGLEVPLWTATGWGGAQVPESLLPLYSAYSDGFWDESTTEWPAYAPFHFRYSQVRDDLTVGADLREALDGIVLDPGSVPLKDDEALPFATCELGGGMHVAYHRRPLVSPEDVANLALAKVGSGSIWQGYYMYAGGTQRIGPNGTEQESHSTGYPSDVPTRTYDFGAPIGEHQQVRAHHHLLRRQHLWLALDGSAIAAMTTTVGGGSEDPAELRWAVRSDGHRGYVFVTTYQPPKSPLPAQPGVQFVIELDDATVTIPESPVDLPAGMSVAWPVRYPLTEVLQLRSATAQLLTRLTVDDGDVVVLVASDGVPVEIVMDGSVPVGGAGTGDRHDGRTVISLLEDPGPECVVELPGVRLLVIDEVTANHLYKLPLAGRERLVLSDAPLYARDGGLILHTDLQRTAISVLPEVESLTTETADITDESDPESAWATWVVAQDGVGPHRVATDLEPVGVAPHPATAGGPLGRLSAPTDWTAAAEVDVDVAKHLLTGVDRVLLRINWTGDVGRALIGTDVVSDHYWHGPAWDIDLTPDISRLSGQPLRLELFPWDSASGVWVDPAVRGVRDGIHIHSVDVVRVARVPIKA